MSRSLATVSELVDDELENHRSVRYRGEEQAVPLDTFAWADRAPIRALYTLLAELDSLLADPRAHDGPERLLAFTARHDIGAMIQSLRHLGAESPDERLAGAIHDIRGGALTALFVQLRRVAVASYRPEFARGIAIAARDHMKIMRTVVRDLDDDARARDLSVVPHSLGQLANALREFTAQVGDQRIVTDVTCTSDETVIAETCVECATVDRVAYNLLNNAAAHTTKPTIDVELTPHGRDVRIVVANGISAEHRSRLLGVLESDPSSLFGAFSTTGSGQGLRIASDLVARAYGIQSIETLVEKGYIGGRVIDGSFVSWFHWPLSSMAFDG